MPLKFEFKKVPVSDGVAYDSMESFQAAELGKIIAGERIGYEVSVTDACSRLVENKAAVIEILELTLDARPKARGQKRPRKPKIVSAQPELPDTEEA